MKKLNNKEKIAILDDTIKYFAKSGIISKKPIKYLNTLNVTNYHHNTSIRILSNDLLNTYMEFKNGGHKSLLLHSIDDNKTDSNLDELFRRTSYSQNMKNKTIHPIKGQHAIYSKDVLLIKDMYGSYLKNTENIDVMGFTNNEKSLLIAFSISNFLNFDTLIIGNIEDVKLVRKLVNTFDGYFKTMIFCLDKKHFEMFKNEFS